MERRAKKTLRASMTSNFKPRIARMIWEVGGVLGGGLMSPTPTMGTDTRRTRKREFWKISTKLLLTEVN